MAIDKRIGNKFALGLTTNGRPPMFETPEELKEKITDYFSQTEMQDITITGLSLFLGFESRQSFYDYQAKKDFAYIIKRARLVIENKYEMNLKENNATGSIFALKNMGWKDKTEHDHTTKGQSINHISLGKGVKPPEENGTTS